MSKFKHVLLAIAIAIVFAFFIGFGIAAFYEAPEHEDFCEETFYEKPYPRPIMGEAADCTYKEPNEELKKECKDKGDISANYDEDGCVESYYCETCRKKFEDVRENYNRNVFIIATIFGIIALIVGIVLKITSVSSGLMGGGVLLIIYGIIRYWSGLENYGRFTVMGIALVILIWLGYKKLKQ
ncbi:hypothetical protein CMO94_03800 [Candidatus Woesearchaeota archaeon]|jgi:hypothetical protein|nr:hypothetical protein [Candidatus Woesearchaeota archaeon]|tara:strand:- start:754 stop:1302 length:549 start_codon:yes stop_codon:yes gene_type:complete